MTQITLTDITGGKCKRYSTSGIGKGRCGYRQNFRAFETEESGLNRFFLGLF